MTGIPKGGKEISVKILLLARLYRQNNCNGLTDFAVLAKNIDFDDFDGEHVALSQKERGYRVKNRYSLFWEDSV